MGKNKFKRFQENETFGCLIQPSFEEVFRKDHSIKGKWHETVFGNRNPIVLELGCGRGEYTVALAEKFPDKNFIGVDIKGARMWRGAKTATEQGMDNAAFLRTRIELIESFFARDEVDGIWITFPDPQLRKSRVKKRLTSPAFLKMYAGFLKPEGYVNLKTDSQHLHEYTYSTAQGNGLKIHERCNDIYGTGYADELLSVKTTYEQKFLAQGMPITFLSFSLVDKREFEAVEFGPDADLLG